MKIRVNEKLCNLHNGETIVSLSKYRQTTLDDYTQVKFIY